MFARAVTVAPLMPWAFAATIGILWDRRAPMPVPIWMTIAVGAGMAALTVGRRLSIISSACLWVALGAVSAAHHHARRYDFPADDVGYVVDDRPRLAAVRGRLVDEPVIRRPKGRDTLTSIPRESRTTVLLDVKEVDGRRSSGRLRMSVDGELTDVHIGDTVEAAGWLQRPPIPMNPGERDLSAAALDDRVRAELHLKKSPDGVVRLERAEGWSPMEWLADLRARYRSALRESLDRGEADIASALLIGETTAMTTDEWDRFVRTGVIHVLAISGQHLVILGAFLWVMLRACGVRRKSTAVIVAGVLLAYALLTGGRPSAMRAAVMAGSVCAAVLLNRRALPGNSFALAWLVVLALNPDDLFNPGFQLSFLCVAVLIWGIPVWFPPRQRTIQEELIEESYSLPVRLFRSAARATARAYLITTVLSVAAAPLVMYWQNLVSPVGLVIGPPAILLTSIALIAGFLLLLTAPFGPIALPFAAITNASVSWCDRLVRAADQSALACWYVGAVPLWWVAGLLLVGLIWLISGSEPWRRIRSVVPSRVFVLVLAVGSVFGLVLHAFRPTPDELRITFIAVGHGGCTLLELPDGRVVLYDVGSMTGPDVARRQIAPLLWSRGVRRIDEVFISHGDLDHFNGLPMLLQRFRIGRVTTTPSFGEKTDSAVAHVLKSLVDQGIEVRTAITGDRFETADTTIEILHPPPEGPAGVENVRSMVVLVRHRGHRILLTGDIEKEGLRRVLQQSTEPIDVLMAPHHGSAADQAGALADWAEPRMVVSCHGPLDAVKAQAVYTARGIPFWGTWPRGAITVRSHATGLTAESFVDGERIVIRGRGVR